MSKKSYSKSICCLPLATITVSMMFSCLTGNSFHAVLKNKATDLLLKGTLINVI